jgi:hypothetical protein
MVPFTLIVIFPTNTKLQVRVTNLIGPLHTTQAFGVTSAPSVATQFPASLIFRFAWRHNFRPPHDNRFPRAGAEGAELILALSIFGHILRSTLVLLMPTE